MSTSVLKALPGKLDIKKHSLSILYLCCLQCEKKASIELFMFVFKLMVCGKTGEPGRSVLLHVVEVYKYVIAHAWGHFTTGMIALGQQMTPKYVEPRCVQVRYFPLVLTPFYSSNLVTH